MAMPTSQETSMRQHWLLCANQYSNLTQSDLGHTHTQKNLHKIIFKILLFIHLKLEATQFSEYQGVKSPAKDPGEDI